MFESFEWAGLENVPVSQYKAYTYDIKILEGYNDLDFIKLLYGKLKHTDLSLYRLQRKYTSLSGEEQNDDKSTLVIKSGQADDKTYLLFDFKTMEGQAKPDDMSRIANFIKYVPDVQSITRTSERTVYRLTDEQYKDLLIRQIRAITREILFSEANIPNDPRKAQIEIKNLSMLFSLEKALPREGTIIQSGNIDRFTTDWVRNMLEFEHKLGYLSIDRDFIEQINRQTHEYALRKGKELTEHMNRFESDFEK